MDFVVKGTPEVSKARVSQESDIEGQSKPVAGDERYSPCGIEYSSSRNAVAEQLGE